MPTDEPSRIADATVRGLATEPHRRRNALTGEWVLVSAGRTERPWLGAEEPEPPEDRPAYDPGCYLCPGNTRAKGDVNPAYDQTFVFTNDFAALRPDSSDAAVDAGLFRAEGTRGTCRVVCFSPRHDVTLAGMTTGGDPADRRRVGRRDHRARAALPLGPGVREPGRGDGRLATRTRTARSGPATPCPVEARHEQRGAGALPRADRPPAAARLRDAGARRAAGGRRVPRTGWSWCRSGPPGRSRRSGPDDAGPRGSPTWTTPAATGWRRRCRT